MHSSQPNTFAELMPELVLPEAAMAPPPRPRLCPAADPILSKPMPELTLPDAQVRPPARSRVRPAASPMFETPMPDFELPDAEVPMSTKLCSGPYASGALVLPTLLRSSLPQLTLPDAKVRPAPSPTWDEPLPAFELPEAEEPMSPRLCSGVKASQAFMLPTLLTSTMPELTLPAAKVQTPARPCVCPASSPTFEEPMPDFELPEAEVPTSPEHCSGLYASRASKVPVLTFVTVVIEMGAPRGVLVLAASLTLDELSWCFQELA